MGRLRQYFESAQTSDPAERRIGFEVETLFVDGAGEPLSEAQGRQVFDACVDGGWSAGEEGWELRRDGFLITPEVGAGNIELITPPRAIDDVDRLVDETLDELKEVYRAAADHDAHPVFEPYDGFQHVDNVLLPDERDRKWASVDGRDALTFLGHIASVHVTVDLASIAEGFAWTAAVNAFADERGWPAPETERIWSDYLEASRVDYETGRAGPAPESFEAYLSALRSYVVVMDREDDGGLHRLTPDPPRLADLEASVDLPTFLGTVWFHTRLRVLGERLVLEIRAFPRRSDTEWVEDVRDLLDRLAASALSRGDVR